MFLMAYKMLRYLSWKEQEWSYRSRYCLPAGVFNGYDTILSGDGDIRFGEGSYIGAGSEIYVAEGTSFSAGRNVRIGKWFYCHTISSDPRGHIAGRCATVSGDAMIGDDVWIGTKVFMKHGVSVGDNVVIGANSTITMDIPSGQIWAGNPIRRIG